MKHNDLITVALIGSAKKEWDGKVYYANMFKHDGKVWTVRSEERLAGNAAVVKFLQKGSSIKTSEGEKTIEQDCFSLVSTIVADEAKSATSALKEIEDVW